MKIVNPVLLNIDSTAIANKHLDKDETAGWCIKAPCAFLHAGSAEYDYLRAFAGLKTVTVVAARGGTFNTLEEMVRSNLPRFISGMFEDCHIVGFNGDVVVVELVRQDHRKDL